MPRSHGWRERRSSPAFALSRARLVRIQEAARTRQSGP